MKIDIFYEIQMPKPWRGPQDQAEYEIYWETMEQIELADRVGFDTVWIVEHHSRIERSHSSAPEVFLGAAAQRTSRIRLGHGVVLIPHPFNHPIRVAERAAVLDILSNGRLEFGTGRSEQYEQQGFLIDPAQSRDMWREALEIIPQMWLNETFSHKGKYLEIPERNILPKPFQKPHPPIWMAATSEESFSLAGELGIGALGLTVLVPLEEFALRIQMYRDAITRSKPVGSFLNNRIGAFTLVHCAETHQGAIDHGFYEALYWWFEGALPLRAALDSGDSNNEVFQKYPILRRFLDSGVNLGTLDEADMVIGGDPEQVIRKLERYEAAGLDHILCQMQVGSVSHENILKSIELFGQHVIPHFKTRAPSTIA